MNWGLSLLAIWPFKALEEGQEGLFVKLSMVIYDFFMGLVSLLYRIWEIIASVVNAIEGVFRNLAGIGDQNSTDMFHIIYTNSAMKNIFGNLVAVSVALMIFFTILKIIQQHYKEKDGGNPYMVVFRMFKGLLMFFFVTAAVVVGVYAAGVVFNVLDAATGGGSVSIAGQVFEAMAYDANRKRMPAPTEGDMFYAAKNAYYNRLVNADQLNDSSGVVSGGAKYTIVTLKGKISPQQLRTAYMEMDENKWAIVNKDGSMRSVLSLAAGTGDQFIGDYSGDYSGISGDLMDIIDKNFKDSPYDSNYWGNGYSDSSLEITDTNVTVKGHAGYKNDLLQGITLTIQPKVSIEYSPISIFKNYWNVYKLTTPFDISPEFSVMGNYVKIPMHYKYVYYIKDKTVLQPISEKNMFSINMSAGVSLQGDEVATDFSLDLFKNQAPLDKIIKTLIVYYTMGKLIDALLYSLPGMPLLFYIYSQEINLLFIAAQFIKPIVNTIVEGSLRALLGPGQESPLEIGSGTDVPLTVDTYRFPKNFREVWEGMLGTPLKQFMEDLKNATQEDADGGIKALKDDEILAEDIGGTQGNWIQYKAVVDNYNNTVASMLHEFTARLYMQQNPSVTSIGGYNNNNNEGSLISIYKKMLDTYAGYLTQMNHLKGKYKSGTAQSYVGQIYMPIFTSGDVASSINAVNQVVNGSYNINLAASGANIIRAVDWDLYKKSLASSKVADIFKNSVDELRFFENNTAFASILNSHGTRNGWTAKKGNFTNLTLANLEMAGASDDLGVIEKETETGDLSLAAIDELAALTDLTESDNANLIDETENKDNVVVRSSQAYSSMFNEMANDVFKNVQEALFLDENNNPVASGEKMPNTFSNQIITFRDMEAYTKNLVAKAQGLEVADTKSDATALKEWVSYKGTVKIPGEHSISRVCLLEPEAIDAFMVTPNTDDERRYLMLAEEDGSNSSAEDEFQRNYIGLLSYTDPTTVAALYDMASMNYFIGYAAIIVALGVYMNFTFGLIQRVVNMAVLYIMSPLSISFFPYDDGAKFRDQFISPFYKQTISAFAIIISLNLFMQLYPFVTDAVVTASGVSGGFVKHVVNVFAVMAFVTMLPGIRDSVCSILGADKLAEKGLLETFQSAGNTLKKPFADAIGIGAGALGIGAKAIKPLALMKDRFGRNKSKRQERWDKFSTWAKKTKAGQFLDKHIGQPLSNLVGKDKLAQDQKAVDEVNAIEDENARSAAAAALTGRAGRLYRAQQKAADKKIDKMSAAEKRAEGIESFDSLNSRAAAGEQDAVDSLSALNSRAAAAGVNARDMWGNEQNAKVNDLRNRLLNDDSKGGLRESTNHWGLAKGLNTVLSVPNRVGGALKFAGGKVQGFMKYSLVGDALETLFNPVTGMMANTQLGKGIKWMQPSEQAKRWQEQADAERKWRESNIEARENREKHGIAAANFLKDRDNQLNDDARQIAMQNQADNMGDVDETTARHLYMTIRGHELMESGGMGRVAAFRQAQTEFNATSGAARAKLLSDSGARQKYLDDLIAGTNELQSSFLQDAKNQINDAVKLGDTESLRKSMQGVDEAMEKKVLDLMKDVQDSLNLTGADRLSDAACKDVANWAKSGEDAETIARRLTKKLPKAKQEEILNALQGANFTSEVNKVKLNQGTKSAVAMAASNFINKTKKADEELREEMGISVNSGEFQRYYQAYRMVFDADMEGGMQKQEEALRARFKNDINNPEYQREWNKLRQKYERQYEMASEALGNLNTIRKLDYGKRQIEKEQAEFEVMIGKQYQNRIDYHLKVNMDTPSKNVMLSDSRFVELSMKGDMIGASKLLRDAVDAAQKKNWDKLNATGVDKETAAQFKKWAESGGSIGAKRLKSIDGYGDIIRQFMGNAQGSSSGRNIDSTRNQVAAIFQVTQGKEISEHYKKQAAAFASTAGSLMNSVAMAQKSLPAQFAGPVGQVVTKHLKLTNEDGSPLVVKDMQKYVDDVLTRATLGELTIRESKMLAEGMSRLASDTKALEDFKKTVGWQANSVVSFASSAAKPFNEYVRADELQNDSDLNNSKAQEIFGKTFLASKKMDTQGGK